jgi:hypothetical protein
MAEVSNKDKYTTNKKEIEQEQIEQMTYKVIHVTRKNQPKSIYVFTSDMNSLDSIFTVEETQFINDNNVSVKYVPYEINYDDTILDIKLKIANAFKIIDKTQLSVEELMLYYRKREKIDSLSLYESLNKMNTNLFNSELNKISSYRRKYVKPFPITNTTIKTYFENVLFDDENRDITDYNMNIHNDSQGK